MSWYTVPEEEEPTTKELVCAVDDGCFWREVIADGLGVEPEGIPESSAAEIWGSITAKERMALAVSWYEHDCDAFWDWKEEQRKASAEWQIEHNRPR